MGNTLGKRYECTLCGAEILCTKAGEGTLSCCGQEMTLKKAKPLPTSD
jgi:desulfoferrodoxin-like iron-binding protein